MHLIFVIFASGWKNCVQQKEMRCHLYTVFTIFVPGTIYIYFHVLVDFLFFNSEIFYFCTETSCYLAIALPIKFSFSGKFHICC